MCMKTLLLLTLLLFFGLLVFSQNLFDGVYKGLDPIIYRDLKGNMHEYRDPSLPSAKWYHTTYIKFIHDSIYVDQSPIYIIKNDTSRSASDGGFYYYRGVYKSKGDSINLALKEIGCDYCPKLRRKNKKGIYVNVVRKKIFIIKSKHGILWVNGYPFNQISDFQLISENFK